MKRIQVCFGYQTALQILRVVSPDALSWVRKGMHDIPTGAPGKDEIATLLERMELTHSTLKISRPAHVLIKTTARRRGHEECKPHVSTKEYSPQSFYRLDGGALVSGPALAFIQMASQAKNMISLLELGYELCGSYRTARTSVSPAYQVKPLISVQWLRSYASRNPSIDGAAKAAHVSRYLADDSASPRETKQALVLGLPKMYGGYGLGIPWMNYEVAATPVARALAGKTYFRCDLCWPEAKLDVEYQSKEMHAGEDNRIKDTRRTNALMAMGWTVVWITNAELDSFVATEAIAQTLRRHLKIHSQTRVSEYHARKLRLRRHLGLPVGYE